MIWFALIVAFIVFGVVGLASRRLQLALHAGFITLIVGVAFSLLVVYLGWMGG